MGNASKRGSGSKEGLIVTSENAKMKEKIEASIVLAAVGDIIGYRKGLWEFNFSGEDIHKECNQMYGGIAFLEPKYPVWNYSDDTAMHIATIETLIATWEEKTIEPVMKLMAKKYVESWDDMEGRAPGATTGKSIDMLRFGAEWDSIPYNKAGGGCGGSMRAMAIGLRFNNVDYIDQLVAVSIESGRLTHNHVIGFMGAMVSAVFTSFAVQDVPPKLWGHLLIQEVIPIAKKYLKKAKRDWEEIEKDLPAFEEKFNAYLELRKIADGKSEPVFPSNYGVAKRDEQYKKWSFSGWGGASGDDSVIIAYDALLGAKDNWNELLSRAALHGGDSDSTGTIAAAWYGALYGYKNVPKNHLDGIEKEFHLKDLAAQLLKSMVKSEERAKK